MGPQLYSPREGETLKPEPGPARRHKHVITIILASAAIVLEVYYSICAGACSYLRGSIFGIDLQYIGMAYMVCLILLSLLRKDVLLLILICAGVGIEFYLIGFQIWHNTYCPYCLAFAAIIFILFFLNFDRGHKTACFISMALALVFFSIFFKGSLVPTYSYALQPQPPQESACKVHAASVAAQQKPVRTAGVFTAAVFPAPFSDPNDGRPAV